MWDKKRNSSRNTLLGLNRQGHGSIHKPYILFTGIRLSFQISFSVSSFLWVFLDIKKELYSSPIKFWWAPATLTNSLIFYMIFEFRAGTPLETINSRNRIKMSWFQVGCSIVFLFSHLGNSEILKPLKQWTLFVSFCVVMSLESIFLEAELWYPPPSLGYHPDFCSEDIHIVLSRIVTMKFLKIL